MSHIYELWGRDTCYRLHNCNSRHSLTHMRHSWDELILDRNTTAALCGLYLIGCVKKAGHVFPWVAISTHCLLTWLHYEKSKDFISVLERRMYLHLSNISLDWVSNLLWRWFEQLDLNPPDVSWMHLHLALKRSKNYAVKQQQVEQSQLLYWEI